MKSSFNYESIENTRRLELLAFVNISGTELLKQWGSENVLYVVGEAHLSLTCRVAHHMFFPSQSSCVVAHQLSGPPVETDYVGKT